MFHVEHSAMMQLPEYRKCLGSIGLDDAGFNRLEMLVRLLEEWNRKVNLVSRADILNVRTAHILHSLSPLMHFPLRTTSDVLDIGTGGGFPGLPLAIARPGVRFLLVDGTGKKVKAVEDMACRLGLGNVRVLHARAEDLARDPACKDRFDLVLARAVASLGDLIRWSVPLVRHARPAAGTDEPVPGADPGLPALVAYKGGDIQQEVISAQTKYPAYSFRIIDLHFPPAADLRGKLLAVVRL